MTELAIQRQKALAEVKKSFTEMLAASSSGEYFIPHLRMTTQTPEGYALQTLTSQLSMTFPEFLWSQSDSLNPNNLGLTIRWTRRATPVKGRNNDNAIDS